MINNITAKIWGLGLILTLLSAMLATSFEESKTVIIAIFVITILKFMTVANYFMELRKAHIFWKSILLCFLILFSIIILAI